MLGYIYKTTNLCNSKIYVGKHSGSQFDKNYYGSGSLITAAVEYYGKENFKIEILEEIDDLVILDDREIYWIDFYNSTDADIGYNISEGGRSNDFSAQIRRSHEGQETVQNEERKMLYSFIKEQRKQRRNNKPKTNEDENKPKTRRKLDPRNVIVIHKGDEKKFINIVLSQPYFDEGWEFGWPEKDK